MHRCCEHSVPLLPAAVTTSSTLRSLFSLPSQQACWIRLWGSALRKPLPPHRRDASARNRIAQPPGNVSVRGQDVAAIARGYCRSNSQQGNRKQVNQHLVTIPHFIL